MVHIFQQDTCLFLQSQETSVKHLTLNTTCSTFYPLGGVTKQYIMLMSLFTFNVCMCVCVCVLYIYNTHIFFKNIYNTSVIVMRSLHDTNCPIKQYCRKKEIIHDHKGIIKHLQEQKYTIRRFHKTEKLKVQKIITNNIRIS